MESKGMFEKNLRFAYWYVRKHFPMYADDEDIMQEALIGLWKASQSYIRLTFSVHQQIMVRTNDGRLYKQGGRYADPARAKSRMPERYYSCSKCGGRGHLSKKNFCDFCGAPMTDAAVDMVMERLEALGYGKDD